MIRNHRALALAMLAATLLPAGSALAGGEVNIYSYRQEFLIRPLLDAFTKKTGIKANVIFASKGLVDRMKAEGSVSPADILLTVDIGRLTNAVESGVTQPVNSAFLAKQIPPQYRGKSNQWFALTRRARVILASKERVKQDKIRYEELADPKWKGKICIRSGQHVYNLALFAAMIAHLGEEKAKAWLAGLKANLARKPSGNDRNQTKGVYSGICDLAISNTYYMGKMQTNDKKPEQKKWAASVKMLFPNTDGRGTHVNVSGMVLAKYAPHKANAIKLMEYLASDEAQKIYAETNLEYPVSDHVPWSDLVKSWGVFKADDLTLDKVASLRRKASEMVDEVNFNAGPSN
jgi:iron(III) transport system substrate-binding protein